MGNTSLEETIYSMFILWKKTLQPKILYEIEHNFKAVAI